MEHGDTDTLLQLTDFFHVNNLLVHIEKDVATSHLIALSQHFSDLSTGLKSWRIPDPTLLAGTVSKNLSSNALVGEWSQCMPRNHNVLVSSPGTFTACHTPPPPPPSPMFSVYLLTSP